MKVTLRGIGPMSIELIYAALEAATFKSNRWPKWLFKEDEGVSPDEIKRDKGSYKKII